jgi:hypothetical protein
LCDRQHSGREPEHLISHHPQDQSLPKGDE